MRRFESCHPSQHIPFLVEPSAVMSGPPDTVLMVRPHHFRANPETLVDNGFQIQGDADGAAAGAEVSALADMLQTNGVRVELFEDEGYDTPDSVFPNNWFSTHADGTFVTYPMRAENRRRERRQDIVRALGERYCISRRLDFSHFETHGRFLEGTGSLVLDREGRVAFACRSPRTDEELARIACKELGYDVCLFDAHDAKGRPVYHTNVLLTLGHGYALFGAEMVRSKAQRAAVVDALGARDIVTLSETQVGDFAANAIELGGKDGPLLALSARAATALSPAQRRAVERHVPLHPVSVPTIERAGGSVRCMIATIHLPLRN